MFSFVPNWDLFSQNSRTVFWSKKAPLRSALRNSSALSDLLCVCLSAERTGSQPEKQSFIRGDVRMWRPRRAELFGDAGGARQWFLESRRPVQTAGLNIQTLLIGRGWNNDWPLTSSVIIHPLFVTRTFRIPELICVYWNYSWLQFGFVMRFRKSLFFFILWKIRCYLRGINYYRGDTATQQ